MYKLKIASISKTKEQWLEQAIQEYLKRLKPILLIEFLWYKNDEQLIDFAQKEPLIICLDEKGLLMNSEQLSRYLYTKFQEGGARLAMIIGGPNGLPPQLKNHSHLLSLSPLTFTHQMTRLVLLEQIYRAFEILKGSQYHRR